MIRLLLKYKNWQKGLERERGFNSFLSLKGGGYYRGGGGLIEDFWYARFFKSTISLIIG